MKRYDVYVDGVLVGIVRASSLSEATSLAKEKYVDWPEQTLKVVEAED